MLKALFTPAAVIVTLFGPAAAQVSPGAQPQTPPGAMPAPLSFLSVQKPSDKSASELIGTPVVDRSGEAIGKISDLIFDHDQKTVGAVLLIGGVMGIGGKLVGVPWQAVSFQQSKDGKPTAAVAFARNALETAPEFKTQAQLKAEEDRQRARSQQQSPAQSPRPNAPMPR